VSQVNRSSRLAVGRNASTGKSARSMGIVESVPRLDSEKGPDHDDGKCNDAERGRDQKPRWYLRFVVLNFLSHSVLPSAVTSGRGTLKTLAPKMMDLTSVSPQLPKGISHPLPHSRCLSLPPCAAIGSSTQPSSTCRQSAQSVTTRFGQKVNDLAQPSTNEWWQRDALFDHV
jgi:hypothetical protein